LTLEKLIFIVIGWCSGWQRVGSGRSSSGVVVWVAGVY